MRRRKAKALAVFFVLTLAVALTVALTVLARTTEEELQNSFDKVGSNIVIVPKTQDLTLSYNGISVPGVTLDVQEMDEKNLALIKTIKEKSSIAVVAPKLIGNTTIAGKAALIVGVNLSSELAMKSWWNLEDGTTARKLAKTIANDEVIVGSDASKYLNLKSGSSVSIGAKTFKVRAVLQSMGSEEDKVLFIDLHKAQEILNKPGKVSFVELAALCYTCPIDKIVQQISAVLPDTKVSALRQSLDQRKQTVERFAKTARAVAIAILILGILITANTVAASINERSREIGIFRAIGFRKIHIVKIIFAELSISAFAAAFVGGILGGGMAFVIAPVIMDLPLKVHFIFQDVILAIGVSAGTAIVASLLPMLKVIAKSPADALRTL
jgi:putative ABC transport system permease protein